MCCVVEIAEYAGHHPVNYKNDRSMMMKKIGFFLTLIVFLFAFPRLGFAASADTHIYLDGLELSQPSNAQAGNVKGSVMVPIRVIVEGLGYDVGWEKKSGTVTIKQGDTELKLLIDKDQALIGDQSVTLAAAPFLLNNTTMVPLRFVSESMGLKVSWDNKEKSAYLYSPEGGAAGEILPENGTSLPSDSGETVVNNPEQEQGNGYITETTTHINGVSFSDNKLMIAVDRAVQPSAFAMFGPDRIVVDLPMASFGDTFALDSANKGELLVTDNPAVSKVRYSLFDSTTSTIRFVIDLNSSSQFAITNAGDGLVIIDLSGQSTSPNLPIESSGNRVVVIDAGHGGTDPGTSSPTRLEKDFNLAIALKVEALLKLEPNITVVMNRSDDTTLTLKNRPNIANNIKADIFVSIHANSVDKSVKTNPSGTETYYTREDSIALANMIHKHLVQATGLNDRKVRQKNLLVTRETMMPAVLLESGYLSNSFDESVLFDPIAQDRIAAGIVAGIKEYFGL